MSFLQGGSAISDARVTCPTGGGTKSSRETDLIASCAEDFYKHSLIGAHALHGFLQLPSGIFTGAVQKGQGCLLEVSTQFALEHVL